MKASMHISGSRWIQIILKQIIFMWLTSSCSCQLICPPAEIGSSVELICNYPLQTSTWVNFNSPSGGEASCSPDCSSSIRFNISVVNETQSRLTVLSVEWKDEGEWICKYGLEAYETLRCNMNLYKIPSCEISSDNTTSDIILGEERRLTLSVTKSYCTENNTFKLQTGDVTYTQTGQARQNISDSFEYSFNVSESHIGPVTAVFECGNQPFNLSCVGVTKLEPKGEPAGKNICSVNYFVFGVIGIAIGSICIIVLIIVMISRFAKGRNISKETTSASDTTTGQTASTGQPQGHYSTLHSDPQHHRQVYNVIENEGENPSVFTTAGIQEQGQEYITPV